MCRCTSRLKDKPIEMAARPVKRRKKLIEEDL